MSVTYGFYNSLGGDRKYNALQMSSIFDGIINDGVYMSIGTSMRVTPTTGITVSVGIGRAWFNHTWTLNDSELPIEMTAADILLDRIDAVILEVNAADAARANSIKAITGEASSEPSRPILINTDEVHQYPLAYIYRPYGSTAILQDDITNMVGTSDCPYVTGIIETINIDSMVAQWEAQWNTWFTNQQTSVSSQMSDWMSTQQVEFTEWFESLQVTLDEEVATRLAAQILELKSTFDTLANENRIYMPLTDSSGYEITDNNGDTIVSSVKYKIA